MFLTSTLVAGAAMLLSCIQVEMYCRSEVRLAEANQFELIQVMIETDERSRCFWIKNQYLQNRQGSESNTKSLYLQFTTQPKTFAELCWTVFWNLLNSRTLSKVSWLSTPNTCLTVLGFGSLFTIQLLLSARNLTHSWGHIGNMQQVAKCVHPNIVLIFKNTAFLYLPGMDSTNMKYIRYPATYSIPTVYNCVNKMPFLPKVSSVSVTYQLSHTKTRSY